MCAFCLIRSVSSILEKGFLLTVGVVHVYRPGNARSQASGARRRSA